MVTNGRKWGFFSVGLAGEKLACANASGHPLMRSSDTIFCASIGLSRQSLFSIAFPSRNNNVLTCSTEYVQGLHKLFVIIFAFIVGAVFSETLAAMAGENMILDLSGPDNRYAVLDLRQTRSRRSG